MKKKNFLRSTALVTLATLLLTACGGGGGGYDDYAAAYKKVSANGGMEADFDVTLTMDGSKSSGTGNFKLDTSNGSNLLYYEMDIDGSKITQFSDGSYIYTEKDGNKTRYALDKKPAASSDTQKSAQKDSDSTFNKEAFLSEFASFLEAGKIKELGLLSPIEKAAVSDISEEGGVYTLSFSDSLVKQYLNTLIANETQLSGGDTLQIDEMNNFSYKATVKDGIVTNVQYKGTVVVNVPASLMASGNAESYNLDFTIDIAFVNPGSSVSVTVPSTDGYTDL